MEMHSWVLVVVMSVITTTTAAATAAPNLNLSIAHR